MDAGYAPAGVQGSLFDAREDVVIGGLGASVQRRQLGRGGLEDTMVAIVSLGEARPLLLRSRSGTGGTLRYVVGHGDLIVMGGSCQRTWEHAVPKTAKPVGPRISVQYRTAGVR